MSALILEHITYNNFFQQAVVTLKTGALTTAIVPFYVGYHWGQQSGTLMKQQGKNTLNDQIAENHLNTGHFVPALGENNEASSMFPAVHTEQIPVGQCPQGTTYQKAETKAICIDQ